MTENKKKDEEVGKTGHIYDGIEELDHPTPDWFMGLFYATIVFGILYFLYFNFFGGPTLVQEYNKEKQAEQVAFYENQAKTGTAKTLTEQELGTLSHNPEVKKLGATLYQGKCASCHGPQGQGGIGTNLTDEYWIHGGQMTEILKTIASGVADKGMPPWGTMMTAEEVQAVTAYVKNLAGTKPPGAKAPQGELVKSK